MPARTRVPLILFVLLFATFVAGATEVDKRPVGSNGSVSGTVKDSAGAVLQGAQVVLKPTGLTVASDAQGSFLIRDVKPGTYTVTISYIGFATSITTVTVTASQMASLDITLTVNSANQQIEVTATLEGDAAAVNEQRTSENILNVQTDTQIQSLPNANIADAVGRMPGVTLQRNEGEGQYVQIRGTEPRLSNTTIDGVIVPGPDPEVRQVDLDTIPADLVGSVAINKTLSANQDGDAIGGSVDLRIKQATSDRPTLMVEGTEGYTPIANGRKAFQIDSSAGFRFGQKTAQGKRFGLMLGYSYDYNGRAIDDVEPVPNFDGPNNAFTFDQLYIQQYLYDRTRYGMAGSLDYKLNENSDLYMHGLFSNFRDFGQKYAYQLTENSDPVGQKPNGKTTFHTSIRRPNLQIADLAIGGNQLFSHSYLRYQIAAAHSRFGGAAGNPGAAFKTGVGKDCSYVPGPSQYRPQYDCDVAGNPIFDPTQYGLDTIDLTFGQATQLNLQASAAVGINYHLGSHFSTFEFGGQFRNEHKGQDAYSPEYDSNNGTAMSQYLSTFTNNHFYGGSYHLGPVTEFSKITGDLAQNPANFTLDEGTTHLQSDAANYNLQERVSAGYIMNTIQLGRFHLQTGLRIEATNTSNTGYLVVNDANGNYISTTPQYGSGSYINPLPSVQLRYTIDRDSDIRAVYGRGISRPDPYQLVPYITEDQSTTPYTINIGNTALVAEHANDYDVLYERYLPSIGMIQAGYFYKQITKPIYGQQSIIPATGSPLSQAYAGDLVFQEVNGDHAYVQGVELAYQQHLNYLPGVLGGARINANFTYTGSRNYNLTGRTDNPALVGQAPFSWNIGPSYATKRALVSMGMSYNSANIYAYQYQNSGPGAVDYGVKGPAGDNYFYPHMQVDSKITYYIGKGFTVMAIGENMNNAAFGFYNGSPQYMVQREYYKPTYSGGVRWTPHHE
ncbi:TonB-dependent receptor [Terracidiphilus gabretensis]|uniref:TonB-dependent receptor n=1 Tax=Terracidiphilus gabretensis TaxID=1577687 RepID=UPI0009E8BA6F|nr:TonB-dependent receptor [Terracidiphilus gabretensis]